MKFDPAAERLGAAVTLLSLDRVLPFHAAMGVRPGDGHGLALRDELRWAIERNREAFVADPKRIPDLAQPLATALRRRFGEAGLSEFNEWYVHDFVHGGEDLLFYSSWYQFFNCLNRVRSRWMLVVLPEGLHVKAAETFASMMDNKDIKALQDEIEKAAMSAWDAKMFTIHRLYDQGRDPFDWILATVNKRRFRMFLRWFSAQLEMDDRAAFVESANVLKNSISTFDGSPAFPPFFDRRFQIRTATPRY